MIAADIVCLALANCDYTMLAVEEGYLTTRNLSSTKRHRMSRHNVRNIGDRSKPNAASALVFGEEKYEIYFADGDI